MPSTDERNAAFNAIKKLIDDDVSAAVPSFFKGEVDAALTDKVVLTISDAALTAAEAVRNKETKPS